HYTGDIEEHLPVGLRDYKTRLQELTQRLFRETPLYTLVEESGPDHARRFVSGIALGGRCYGRGLGRTKKAAEQAAAGEALAALEREHTDRLPCGAPRWPPSLPERSGWPATRQRPSLCASFRAACRER